MGRSHLIGRVFNILANKAESCCIIVVTRGRYKLNLENVTQIHLDRHDSKEVERLPIPTKTFEAIAVPRK
jgi:hypothetical protein